MKKGFTLIEVLVALFIFTLVILAAYKIYDHSQKTYLLGEQLTDTQQSTRFAFEKLSHDLRLAGYRVFPDSDALRPDLSIEGMWDGAIAIRADFDGLEEENLECTIAPATGLCTAGTGQFGMVTTGNRDVRMYVLAKKAPSGPADPVSGDGSDDTLAFKADFSDNRDAIAGDPDLLETVTIYGVSLAQDNPPYRLYMVTFRNPGEPDYQAVPDGGDVPDADIVWTPVADNIFSMRFEYFNQNGISEANRMVLESFGAPANFDPPDVTEPESGNIFRREHGWPFGVGGGTMVKNVLVRLVGMTARPDGKYTDPQMHNTNLTQEERDARELTKMYRKYELNSTINLLNVGVAPHELADTIPPDDPSELDAVVGYCGGALLVWTPSLAADLATYFVQIVDDSLWSTWGDTFLYVCDDAPDTCTPVSNVEVFGTTVGYFRPNLDNGEKYHSRVFAQDAAGNFSRNPTNEIEFIVDPGPLKPNPPTWPDGSLDPPDARPVGEDGDFAGLQRLFVNFTPPKEYDTTQDASCIGEVSAKDGAWPKIRDLHAYRLYHRRQLEAANPVDFTVDPVADLVADEASPADFPLKIPVTKYPDFKACPCEYYAYKISSLTQCEDTDDSSPCFHTGEVSLVSRDGAGNPIAVLAPMLQPAGTVPQIVPAQPDKPGGSAVDKGDGTYDVTLQFMPVLTSVLKDADGNISPNADPMTQFEVWRYRIYEYTEDPVVNPDATATLVDDTALAANDSSDWDAGMAGDADPVVPFLSVATPVKFTFNRPLPASRWYTVAGIFRCDGGSTIIEGPESLPAQVPCVTDWAAVIVSPAVDYTLVNAGGAIFSVVVKISGLPVGVTITDVKLSIAGAPVVNEPMTLTCAGSECTAVYDWNVTGLVDGNYTLLARILDSNGCSIVANRVATIAVACGGFQITTLPVSGPELVWELQKINGGEVYLLDKIGLQSQTYQTSAIDFYEFDPTAGAPPVYPLWATGPADLNGKLIGNAAMSTDYAYLTTNFTCDTAGTVQYPSLNLNQRPGGPVGASNWFKFTYSQNLDGATGPLNLLATFHLRSCIQATPETIAIPKGGSAGYDFPASPVCAFEWSYVGTEPASTTVDLCGAPPSIGWTMAKGKSATVNLVYWIPADDLVCPNMPVLMGP